MRKKLTVLVNQLTPISYMKSEKPSLVSSWYWPSMWSGSWAAATREGRSRSSMLGSELWLKMRELAGLTSWQVQRRPVPGLGQWVGALPSATKQVWDRFAFKTDWVDLGPLVFGNVDSVR